METTKLETAKAKPVAVLVGENGNVFNLIGICSRALKRNGQSQEAKEMQNRCFSASSYDEAIFIMGEYCELN